MQIDHPNDAAGAEGPPAGRPGTLVLGPRDGSVGQLADLLGADEVVHTPDPPPGPGADPWSWDWGAELVRWAEEQRGRSQLPRVVACFPSPGDPIPFAKMSSEDWMAQLEWRMASAFATLQVAGARCDDGGSVVIAVERPYALDALGHSAVVASAEGIVALGRSMAAGLGRRGVRVNAVTMELSTAPQDPIGPSVVLPTFPGRMEHEVVGAVQLLLSEQSAGVTGAVVAADCGRTS